MGNYKIITILFLVLIPFLAKAQDPDWPRFELYQLVQGQDSGIFVITDSDSNLVFTDLLKMRFFPDTALIFKGDTIAVKPDIPTIIDGLGITIEFDEVLNQYTIESLSIEDSIHNGTASLIPKGTPLYAAGVQGNYWSVAPADAGNALKMPVVIIAGEDIAAGEDGLGLIKGHIKQVNTTGLASGAEVYVAVGGGYTAIKPKGENAIVQRLGTVIKGNSTNGSGIINLGDPRTTSNLNPDRIFIGGADSTVTTINFKTTITDSLNNRLTNFIATGATSGSGISGSATGAGSTFTVTSNATTLNTPNTLVFRDGSGNFKAGVIEGNLAGIAREVQSALTPGYGITPSDTYNGSIARTYRIDTALIATLAALRDTATSVRSAITAGVTGTFVNGSVPYSAFGGSALTNSGWYISSGNLIDRVASPSYKLDVNGSIGGTSLTASGAITGQTLSTVRGATFNTEQDAYDFTINGDLLSALFIAKGSTNRIGIGGITPDYTLDVDGDMNLRTGHVYRIAGTPLVGSQWTTTGSDIYYNTGEVGIGNTNPTAPLDVTGNIKGSGDLNIDNGLLFVDASENAVGVGTSSPQFPLDVVGSARIDGSTFFVSSGDDRVGLGTGTPNATLDVRGDAIFNESGGNFDFRVEGDTDANLFFIDASTDRVGIGTNTPTKKLDVNGDINTNSFFISNSSFTLGGIDFYNTSTGTTVSDGMTVRSSSNKLLITNRENDNIEFYTNNTERMRIEGDGDIVIADLSGVGTAAVEATATGQLQRTSSKMIKENINKSKYGIESVLKLNPVTFYYKNKEIYGYKKDIGFIAEEISEIIPEAAGKSNDGVYYMDKSKITPVLTTAIQELYQMVISQQTQIEELKSEVKQLKKKLKTD